MTVSASHQHSRIRHEILIYIHEDFSALAVKNIKDWQVLKTIKLLITSNYVISLMSPAE
jgi:hypothetical protein